MRIFTFANITIRHISELTSTGKRASGVSAIGINVTIMCSFFTFIYI